MESYLVAILLIDSLHLTWSVDLDHVGVNFQKSGILLSSPDAKSPMYLVELAKHEADVFQALTDIESGSADKIPPGILDSIRRYLEMYSSEMDRISKYSENKFYDTSLTIGENPILAFSMIWRFVHELTLIHFQLQPYGFTEDEEEDMPGELIFDATITKNWPSKTTLEEAMVAIFRIQLTYDLDPTELESGRMLGLETPARLTIPQIAKLGKYAAVLKRYTLAIPWLELAMERLIENPEQEIIHNISLKNLKLGYQETMLEHNLDLLQNPSKEYQFYKEPLSSVLKQTRISTRKLNHTAFRESNSNYENYVEFYYWSLCSGNNHQTEEEKSDLTCWYDTTSSKALTIYPIKTEMLSKKPYLVQLYDVLSNSKIMKFTDPSNLEVRRPAAILDVERQYYRSEVRSSVELSQLNPHSQLTEYIKSLTGLTLEKPHASEPFHLVTYAFGGHFECHLDASPEEEYTFLGGNRVATMLFYLNNVQKGGLTAFPHAGVAATPVKGSALFWFNLKRSGLRDFSTLHCACPVVLGRKSLATKWIRLHEQFRRRPCGLHEDE